MATSTAILKYGTFQFGTTATFPVPQIGVRSSFERIGTTPTGPANRVCVMTLQGRIVGANLNAIETAKAQLEAAVAKERQTLYWHDGTALRVNQGCFIQGLEFGVEWGQYGRTYTITLTYYPLDETYYGVDEVSYGGFTFCASGTSASPMPTMAREVSIDRNSPDSEDRDCDRIRITLNGYFDEGSLTANLAKVTALETALRADDGTLKYGSFIQVVKVDTWSTPPEIGDVRIPYTIVFSYAANLRDGTIKKMVSTRSVSRVTRRNVSHYIPYSDYAHAQILGKTGQTISCTGYIIGTTFAAAQAAANTEINNDATGFPEVTTPAELAGIYGVSYRGVEQVGADIREDKSQCKVEWNITRFYPVPALTSHAIYMGL